MIEISFGIGKDTYSIPFSKLEDTKMTEEEFLDLLIEDFKNAKNNSNNFVDVANNLPSRICEFESDNA